MGQPERRDDVVHRLLSQGEKQVNDVFASLVLAQPQVSKHLRVLRKVGLVTVRGAGQQRRYTLNAERLKAIYDWVRTFEPFWDQQLDRIKERAEQLAKELTKGPDASDKEE